MIQFEMKAVPTTPTHCPCGVELPLLRRYAGLCKACVAKRMRRSVAKPVARPSVRVLRKFVRDGVKHVEVQCSCGSRSRTMREATYAAQRPECCATCRLLKIERNGFEAEHPR